jgi:hypothetical protein
MIRAGYGWPGMLKIEIVEVGPDGHTTFEVEARDRCHRDEMMARIRGVLGEPHEVTEDERADAVRGAASLAWRQQHAGAHEQDRWDAMAWLQRFTAYGRCKCAKCERGWLAGNPVEQKTQ